MWCAHWHSVWTRPMVQVRAGRMSKYRSHSRQHIWAEPAPWITWRRLGNTKPWSRISPRCSHPGEIWTTVVSMWWVLVIWWRMISGLLAMYKIIITQRRVTPQFIGERRRGDLTSQTLHCLHWRKWSSFWCCNNMQHCNWQFSRMDISYLLSIHSKFRLQK